MKIDETSDNNSEVSKVSIKKILQNLTCPLCNELFNEATTICECLHNFCKKCISDKITNENLNCCPVCNVYLGTTPLNKLRKDNNLQIIKEKISVLIDAKKSKSQVQSSQENAVVKPPNLQYKRKEKKPLSSLVDNLPKAVTHDVTTKKRSTPRSRKTTSLQVPTIAEPSQSVDQSCIKKSTSSIPSSENVCHNNDKELSKHHQTNEKEKGKARGSLVRLYDLNKLPTIIEEDEDTSESIMPITISDDDDTTITMPLLKKNDNFENKAKDGKASTKKIMAPEKQIEKHNVEDNAREVKLPRNIDLNKLPSTFYIGESSSTFNNNQPKITNASSHGYKNEMCTSDPKGKGKEIIYIDDDSDEDCKSLGWLSGEQPNIQLNSKSDINEICDNRNDHKGKGKMVDLIDEDDQPLSVISSKLAKKVRGKRKKKVVVQPQVVEQPEVVPPIDIVVNVTTTRAEGTMMMPIWFTLVPSKDQKADAQLPQIPFKHLRVKDENMPISFIRTYIAKKLGLADASEVEIMLHGHPVVPSLSLRNLLEVWCQTATTRPQAIQTTVGSSASDFVMVLTYARKTASP